jgi:hypothetical protein
MSNRCFLPSFSSFGWGVSEEKIKMWKVNGRQTPSDGQVERKTILEIGTFWFLSVEFNSETIRHRGNP